MVRYAEDPGCAVFCELAARDDPDEAGECGPHGSERKIGKC